MNCDDCGTEILGNNVIECASCGAKFCPDHVKETDIGLVCIEDIEMLELMVIDES